MHLKHHCFKCMFLFAMLFPLCTAYGSELYDSARFSLTHDFDEFGRQEGTIDEPNGANAHLNSLIPNQQDITRDKLFHSAARPEDTLYGVEGLMILVEELDSDVESNGLTKSLILKEVRKRLRYERIQILTVKEAFNTAGKPYLYVNLSTHRTSIGLYGYCLRIELNQDVFLARAPHIHISAITWVSSVTGVVGARNVPAIIEDVGQLIDKFIVSYRAVNKN